MPVRIITSLDRARQVRSDIRGIGSDNAMATTSALVPGMVIPLAKPRMRALTQ
jgi:hypothetical protein